jgi:aerobic-type carbon monoxide dehydrogenase small subunit (CoxS/CutS family)
MSDHQTAHCCVVNGSDRTGTPGEGSLLDWLRDAQGEIGVRQACDSGHCGACAVSLDGHAVKSCSVPAAEVQGSRVLTMAGLASAARPAAQAVFAAFRDTGAFQCGYCQPGFFWGATELLEQNNRPSEAQVREAFAGLLCRCTGYQSIVDAVLFAASCLCAEESRADT